MQNPKIFKLWLQKTSNAQHPTPNAAFCLRHSVFGVQCWASRVRCFCAAIIPARDVALKAPIHSSLGQRPREMFVNVQALKARFIRLVSRAFSANHLTHRIPWGVAPGYE